MPVCHLQAAELTKMNLYFFLDQENFQTINDGKTFFLYLPSPGLCSLAGSARDAVNRLTAAVATGQGPAL